MMTIYVLKFLIKPESQVFWPIVPIDKPMLSTKRGNSSYILQSSSKLNDEMKVKNNVK